MKNVIWFQNINTIGGVESVMWNVIKKYKDYDITILYERADPFQINRFSQYADLIKFDKNTFIECDNLFINYGYDSLNGHYKAKKIYYIIHADYEYQKLNCVTEPNFEYLAVSQFAADAYYRKCGIMPKLFPNPITIDKYREAILIVSATRISRDKGDMVNRMEKLANRLDEREIPFLWLVFTNSNETLKNKNIIKVNSRLNIIPYLAKADFVAQLSDSEACCMTALETASVGTPLLITKIPSFYEQGLNDDNSIFFDFDMSNIDECIDKMLKKKFKFEFKAKEDKWNEVLAKGKKKKRKDVFVQVIQSYLDLQLNQTMTVGAQLYMATDRAKLLESMKLIKIIKEN